MPLKGDLLEREIAKGRDLSISNSQTIIILGLIAICSMNNPGVTILSYDFLSKELEKSASCHFVGFL